MVDGGRGGVGRTVGVDGDGGRDGKSGCEDGGAQMLDKDEEQA